MINFIGLNRTFREVNDFRGRYRVLMGSAGSGKSVNTARDFIAKLSDENNVGANLLVVRKTAATHINSTYAELFSAVRCMFKDRWEEYWKVRLQPLSMTCLKTGNSIIFRGMLDQRQREKIKSVNFETGKLTWIWIEEATELASSDLDILDDRLRGNLGEINANLYYQITLTFNPVSASHWIKSRFFDTVDPDVLCHKSTYLQNRFNDGEYHRRMMKRKQLDPDGYRVYGLGEWGESGGLILPHYEVADVSGSPDAYDFMCMGQDFGFNHANCILEVGFKDGAVYVIRELYLRECDTAQIITIADEQMFSRSLVMYCDSAEPDRIKTWKSHGFKAVAAKKGPGSVKAQIDCLKSRRLIISKTCVNTISEISSWKWQKDEKSNQYTDEPTPKNDDAMAALRYATHPLKSTRRTLGRL